MGFRQANIAALAQVVTDGLRDHAFHAGSLGIGFFELGLPLSLAGRCQGFMLGAGVQFEGTRAGGGTGTLLTQGTGLTIVPVVPDDIMLARGARAGRVSVETAKCVYLAMIDFDPPAAPGPH